MTETFDAVKEAVSKIEDWVREEPTQAIIQAAQSYVDVTPAILQGTPKNIVNQAMYWKFPWPDEQLWEPDIQDITQNLVKASAYIVVAIERFTKELEDMAESLGISMEELGEKIAGEKG